MKISFKQAILALCCISLPTLANVSVEIFEPHFINNSRSHFFYSNNNVGYALNEQPKVIYSDHEMLMMSVSVINSEKLKIASFNLGERFKTSVYNINNGFKIAEESTADYYERLERIIKKYIVQAIRSEAQILCLQGLPSEINIYDKIRFNELLRNSIPDLDQHFDIFYQGKHMIIANKLLKAIQIDLSDISFTWMMYFKEIEKPNLLAIRLPGKELVVVNQSTPWLSKDSEKQDNIGPVVEDLRKVFIKLSNEYPQDLKLIVGDFNREDHKITVKDTATFEGDTNDIEKFSQLISPSIGVSRSGTYTSLKYDHKRSRILSSSDYALWWHSMAKL